MPLFSVIIPAYNRAGLIGQTLDSLLVQQDIAREDLEIIVVDDGSTDGTLDIVAGYGDRVRILRQANRGPGAARNAGLRVAAGEYAAFLDSDDVWFPWTARTYASIIARNERPAFIAGRPLVFGSPADLRPQQPTEDVKTAVFSDYLASGDDWRWYSASSFVMRRDALLAVGGFTDEWVNAEDADAALRMGAAGKFVQVLVPHTFGYRKHAGSAMSDLTRSFRGVRQLILDEQAGKFAGGPARARDRARLVTLFVRPLALRLLGQRDRAPAWELYRRTFGWHLRLGRLRFLGGFPLQALLRKFRGDKP
jgi:glycosyltransferase involved in cell wall biosynthesis